MYMKKAVQVLLYRTHSKCLVMCLKCVIDKVEMLDILCFT